MDKYPIGTVVRLSDDDPEDGPREVAGYKFFYSEEELPLELMKQKAPEGANEMCLLYVPF